jgi:hypothetical protein
MDGGYFTILSWESATRLNLDIVYHDGTQNSTPFFTNLPIEIRVYP